MIQAPLNRSNDLRLAGAFVLAVLSTSVIVGWLLHSLAMVEVLPGADPMPMAVADAFLLIALRHWLPHWIARTRAAGRGLSALIAAVGVVAIAQFLLGRNLGLDFESVHSWVMDDGTVQGRVPLMAAIGLTLVGAIGLVDRARVSPVRARITALMIWLLVLVGLCAAALNWLDLALIYDWSPYVNASLPTALSLVLAGVLAALQRHRHDKFRLLDAAESERRILLVGGALVAVAALTAGWVGIASQQEALGKTLAGGLRSSLASRTVLFRSVLDNAAQQSGHLARAPRTIELTRAYLSPQGADADSSSVSAPLQQTLQRMVDNRHSSAALFSVDGRMLMSAGVQVESPSVVAEVDTDVASELMWSHGLYLRSRVPVMDGTRTMAVLQLERNLDRVATEFFSMKGFGDTGDIALCTQDKSDRTCFPRSPGEAVTRTPVASHASNGAMSRALDGETGVGQMRDFHGHHVIAAYSPFGPGMGLVLKQDTAELYLPVRHALQFAIPAVLVFVVAGVLALRQNLRPLVRGLANALRVAGEQEVRIKTLSQSAADGAATLDALTGLANRRAFEAYVDSVLGVAAAPGFAAEHALLFMDLDQFKIVNDTCGHLAGDELLRRLAAALKSVLRSSDMLARLGGDEFALLLKSCGRQPAMRVAQTIMNAVGDFHFDWNDRTFRIGISIGVVCFTDAVTSPIELLRAADLSCHLAKERGRNRIELHDIHSAEMTRHAGELNWVSRLQEALDANMFVLYRQLIAPTWPQPSMPARYELLIRLREKGGQLVPPGAFIPAAERYNLMPAIDRWVVGKALSLMATTAGPVDRYSINLSGASINDTSMPAFLIESLRSSGVDPGRVCFEVTETEAIANLDSASAMMQALRDLGCQFALDDFGAGMSSFAYLRQLPVDYLKIDGRFVKNIASDAVDLAMVEAVHGIGKRLGLKTVAEFVENDSILEKLREIGVDFAQGYGVAMPEPMPDASEPAPTDAKDAARAEMRVD